MTEVLQRLVKLQLQEKIKTVVIVLFSTIHALDDGINNPTVSALPQNNVYVGVIFFVGNFNGSNSATRSRRLQGT